MAVLFQRASQQYTPKTVTLPFTVPANTASLLLTLTRESWPLGAVGSIAVRYPSGLSAGGCSFAGGDLTDLLGNPETTSTLSVLPINHAPFVPSGTYAVDVTIVQTVSTSVLVEGF